MNSKVRAANISVGSNLTLVAAKLVVGLLTGSVSVLSEAIHSAIDMVAALLASLSVRVSSQPADDEHRYGHGKVENLSALVEAGLIFVAALWIIYESVRKLIVGHETPAVGPGLLVMGLSAGVNWLVSRNLFQVAAAEESAALEADAVHLRTDVWTSLGVFGGLLLVRITGVAWLDPAVALVVSAMIMKAGWTLVRQALTPLLDASLPAEEEGEIAEIILQHSESFVEFHDLRTRRSGSERHVDFHLVVHGRRLLEEVHRLCDRIEDAIQARFPSAQVLIHPEPCEEGCEFCKGRRQRRALLMPREQVRTLRPRGGMVRRSARAEFGD